MTPLAQQIERAFSRALKHAGVPYVFEAQPGTIQGIPNAAEPARDGIDRNEGDSNSASISFLRSAFTQGVPAQGAYFTDGLGRQYRVAEVEDRPDNPVVTIHVGNITA